MAHSEVRATERAALSVALQREQLRATEGLHADMAESRSVVVAAIREEGNQTREFVGARADCRSAVQSCAHSA